MLRRKRQINPGVLVLLQFAGAAQELKSALIVNPYDIEATATAIARAFSMQLDERKDRWHTMMAVLRANSVHDWASQFLQALANEAEGMEFDTPLRLLGVRRPSRLQLTSSPNIFPKSESPTTPTGRG